MNITIENILLIGSALLFLSIMAGKTSYRIGIPTLLLFLSVGIFAGSEGIGGIYFDNPKIAQFIGIVALNFILFSGGLDTSWTAVRPVLKEGIMLSTIGVLVTAVALGTFVWFVTDFTIFESMLLGSIVSSTDAAAVFSILRGKNLALKKNIRPTLELESGSNDPMAYVLTISFLTLVVNQDQEIMSIVLSFFQQMILGALAGLVFGFVSKWIVNRIKLDFEGLYPVLLIALMFITFSFTDFIGGNGFLAIYISSVYLGNQNLIHKKTIMRMFDGMAWLMEIVLFLTLGLLVFPSQMLPFIGIGLLISLFLIFIARPLAVFISLSVFKMKMRRRVFISWVGLRGAVPIVFATYPLLAGIEKANTIFNIVFFISVSSVLIQGTTLTLVAKWLHVGLPKTIKPRSATDKLLHDYPKSTMEHIMVCEGSHAVGRKIVDIDLPNTANIALIERENKYLTPSGATKIQLNDKLYVLTDKPENINEVYDALHIYKS
jgi:cell volume regulation protein A